MTSALVLRREAVNDLQQAYSWYEQRREGLGSAFLAALDQTLRAIQLRPESFPVAAGEVRRAVLHRFPYAVFYQLNRDQILVLAVFHASRKPPFA